MCPKNHVNFRNKSIFSVNLGAPRLLASSILELTFGFIICAATEFGF